MAIPENYKTFLTVAEKQLPGFIRDNSSYAAFVAFVEAYYEWLAESNNIEDRIKNLVNYKDIDNTLDEFEAYFFNQFLPNFPDDCLANKRELVKFSKELYRRKSTPAAYKFLFRSLYNSDCELYNSRESILIASDGKWVKNIYIKVNSIDPNFLQISNYKILGELSQAIAKVVRTQAISGKTVIYLIDIVREFSSGEYVRVVDDQLNDVLFDGAVLRGKIIGTVSTVTINPNYRGKYYNTGDPVLLIGGINPDVESPIKTLAEVGETSIGEITNIYLNNGSNGFRTYSNSIITVAGGSGSGANVIISEVDTTNPAEVTYISTDIISLVQDVTLNAVSYGFSTNPTANANTSLANTLSFINFTTYPIANISVITKGTGFRSSPTITARSFFEANNNVYDLKDFGILSPITINTGGFKYSNGDIITISGGSGSGAYANVKSVNANGTIEQVQYIYDPSIIFPLGGMNYNNDGLPTATVNTKIQIIAANTKSTNTSSILYFPSANVTSNVYVGMVISGNGISSLANVTTVNAVSGEVGISKALNNDNNIGDNYTFDGTASLSIYSILGDGALFSSTTSSVGEIQDIIITQTGEDYISNPVVTLRIVDIILIGVNTLNLPVQGDLVYQLDSNNNRTFTSYFDSIERVYGQEVETYKIKLYDYNGLLVPTNPLYSDDEQISFTIQTAYENPSYTSGIYYYGDGLARANATFIEGTFKGSGEYLNSDGFLSSYCVLEDDNYNDFTYFLTVQKDFASYKKSVYDILHPAGTKLLSRNAVYSTAIINLGNTSFNQEILNLADITYPTIYAEFIDNNVLQFYNVHTELTGISLSSVIISNTKLSLTSTNGDEFYSLVSSVDDANNIVYLTDYNQLTFANVAYGYANSNTVIITSLTGKYDNINNGNYINDYHLQDIARANDQVLIANNTYYSINSIDYINGIIYANTTLYSSGNVSDPNLVTIKRNFIANTILLNYDLDFRFTDASSNTEVLYLIDNSNTYITIAILQ